MTKLNILYEGVISGLMNLSSINFFKLKSEESFQIKNLEILKNTDKVYEKCFEIVNLIAKTTNTTNFNDKHSKTIGTCNLDTDNRQTVDKTTTEINEDQDMIPNKIQKELDLAKLTIHKQNEQINLINKTKESIFSYIDKNMNIMVENYKKEIISLSSSIGVMRDFYEDELIKKCEQVERLTLNIDNMVLK